MQKQFRWASFGVVFLCIFLFFIFVYWLNKPMAGDVDTAASKIIYEKAYVSEILDENAEPDTWTEGLRLGTQNVVLTVKTGEYKGEELPITNYLSAYGNIDLKVGTPVIVRLDKDESGNPYVVTIGNYDRSSMILSLIIIFIALLVLLGGKKGAGAILGIAFTVFSIWFFLIPLIERGFPAIVASIILVAVTTLISLLLLNGFTKKTFVATIGCIGGVAIAGIIAYIAGQLTPINGFNMGEAEELVLRSSESGLKISGLLVSGILIASLGAVMDVAMTITSAVAELHEVKPSLRSKELFLSGMNIGRDAMGTMANTLILAFAGASLNMLVLFRVFDYPYRQIFNSDLMAIEIIQGIAGSIGIVLTVPIVALLSGVLYGKKSKIKKVKAKK